MPRVRIVAARRAIGGLHPRCRKADAGRTLRRAGSVRDGHRGARVAGRRAARVRAGAGSQARETAGGVDPHDQGPDEALACGAGEGHHRRRERAVQRDADRGGGQGSLHGVLREAQAGLQQVRLRESQKSFLSHKNSTIIECNGRGWPSSAICHEH